MRRPNILVCGTPGTGKTQLCASLVEEEPELEHVDISSLVKSTPSLREEFDAQSDAWILNEDAIVDYLEERMSHGGVVVDTHSLLDFFPERWFDLVLVLETTNTLLYDRLKGRGYSEAKVQENVQCEIFNVVRDEAMESYAEEIVQVVPSNTTQDLESNVERIRQWLRMREAAGEE
ncbi:hypothetical protein BASA81_006152 [Batrachochytrium salamandrivorans]|nr:hypothetical protein BASA81_006152 [Batrachochytrium salamandrivorans]